MGMRGASKPNALEYEVEDPLESNGTGGGGNTSRTGQGWRSDRRGELRGAYNYCEGNSSAGR